MEKVLVRSGFTLLAALLISSTASAAEQRYPVRPVRIIVPQSAGGSTDDILAQIMDAPLIRCDDVQWSFLGISMAGWNAIISLGTAGLILWLLVRRRTA